LPAKSIPAAATAAGGNESALTPEAGVRYRVLPKGAGMIYTGAFDPVSGASLTYARGEVVAGVDAAIAAALEDRGLVEVLGEA
jgi:hypothetical protein